MLTMRQLEEIEDRALRRHAVNVYLDKEAVMRLLDLARAGLRARQREQFK